MFTLFRLPFYYAFSIADFVKINNVRFDKINDVFYQVDVAHLPKGIYILKVNQVCNKIIIGD